MEYLDTGVVSLESTERHVHNRHVIVRDRACVHFHSERKPHPLPIAWHGLKHWRMAEFSHFVFVLAS